MTKPSLPASSASIMANKHLEKFGGSNRILPPAEIILLHSYILPTPLFQGHSREAPRCHSREGGNLENIKAWISDYAEMTYEAWITSQKKTSKARNEKGTAITAFLL